MSKNETTGQKILSGSFHLGYPVKDEYGNIYS